MKKKWTQENPLKYSNPKTFRCNTCLQKHDINFLAVQTKDKDGQVEYTCQGCEDDLLDMFVIGSSYGGGR